ncbi:MAG: enoyl-CoA hydratase/isomerase family protein [Gammaproteobacteria bacterium]
MQNLSLDIGADGIGVVTLDMPGRPFNVFSDALIDELDALTTALESNGALRGVIVTSAKDAFMAGADLAMVRGFTTLRFEHDAPTIRRTFSRLGYLLRRFEKLPVPTVAAINGLALGGGLEFAMACHHRVAAQGDTPCLGLPEVLLGLLPGAGGTQRLPRLTSPAFAARMLLDGRPVTPAVAQAAGLVDHLAAPAQLLDSARAIALNARAGARWDHAGWQAPADDEGVLDGDDADARLAGFAWTGPRVAHCYPAIGAITRCLRDGYGRDIDAAIEVEVDNFLPLMLDPVAGNMVRTSFLSKTAAPKRAAAALGESAGTVRRVAVEGDAPARLVRRVEVVEETAAADLVLVRRPPPAGAPRAYAVGLREGVDQAVTGCATELRLARDLDGAEAVEIATAAGEMGVRALALANRLRLVPVVAAPREPGVTARLLGAVRDWCAEFAATPGERAPLADALDLRALFDSAGLATDQRPQWAADHRADGLALMLAVAREAAACLADGLVAGAADLDVLAVVGLGYPAWSGGPLSFLDGVARGEFTGLTLLPAEVATPYYTD